MTKKSAKQEQQQLKPQAVALKPSQDKLPAKAAAILSKKGKKSSSIDAIFASAQSGAAGRHSQLQSRAPVRLTSFASQPRSTSFCTDGHFVKSSLSWLAAVSSRR